MKKFTALFLTAALAAALLAGCGSNDDKGGGSDTGKGEEKKEETKIEGPDDLEGKKIGVQLGTTGDLFISEDFGDENVERYNKGFEAVQALTQNKIDAVVIDDQPAKVFVEQNEGLKILEAEYAVEDYAMCISKDNEELKEKLNTAIKELQDDGILDQIVDYYINEESDGERYTSPEDTDRSNGKLVMATNAEFPPYEFHEGDEIVGIDADFAQAIADKLGMELSIEDMAFDSIIMAVKSGKADFGAAGMTVTEARLKEIDFTDTYYTGRQVIIVNE